jgi:hypothetical protein
MLTERLLQVAQPDTSARDDAVTADTNRCQPLRAEDDVAGGCRAAGERGLRADGQYPVGVLQHPRDFFDGRRPRQCRGVPAWEMCRIFQVAGENISIGFQRNRVGGNGCGDGPVHTRYCVRLTM